MSAGSNAGTSVAGVAGVIEAELCWTGQGFERGVRVGVDADGRIERIGTDAPVTRELPRRALLPGFVNAHSHAFQRGLRGQGERFPLGAGSFWSWREAMYGLVREIDGEAVYRLSRQAFEEMLRAGITSVGEFHYLHHASDDADYAFDEVVARAAQDAGIRCVLLSVYYNAGGIGKPLGPAQRRFRSESPAAYWSALERLEQHARDPLLSVGAVVHSIRAATREDLTLIHAQARERKMPFHMHVEEQRQEIQASLDAYDLTPLECVLADCEPDGRFTIVHATHTRAADMQAFGAMGGNVCLCPLTEASLADGIADVPGMLAAGARVCLGTDSNARIDFLEELRWLEYVQRLRRERRGVVTDGAGSMALKLLEIATVNGARALGLDTGALRPGAWADLVSVDLDAPALAGWVEDTLLESLFSGADSEVFREVCVGGVWKELR